MSSEQQSPPSTVHTTLLGRLSDVIGGLGLSKSAVSPPAPVVPGTTTSVHPLQAPVGDHITASQIPNAVRSPCPALNTLANHGYLPRDGKNITAELLVSAVKQVFNMDPTMLIDQIFPLRDDPKNLNGVRTEDEVLSNGAKFINLDNLSLPHKMEHDCSLSRQDFAFGDNHSVSPALVDALIASSTDGESVTADDLVQYRLRRYWDSKKKNKSLLFGPTQLVTAHVESAVALNVLGRNDRIPIEFIRSFFLHERIPDNWVKPKQAVSIPLMELKTAELLVKWEYYLLTKGSKEPKLPHDSREFELISVPSKDIDRYVVPGNASNLDKRVPKEFHGMFYTQGNPVADEVVSLAFGTWHEEEDAYYLPCYNANMWGYDDTPQGRFVYTNSRAIQSTYKITFDADTGVAHLRGVFNLPLPGGIDVFAQMPDFVWSFTAKPTDNPNVFIRESSLFGREPARYNLVRIVNGDGTRTPEYESVYLKCVNNPVEVYGQKTHLGETQLVAVLKQEPVKKERYHIEITTNNELVGLDCSNLQIQILHSAANGPTAKVLHSNPLKLKKLQKPIFDITGTQKSFHTFEVEDADFEIKDHVHAITVEARALDGKGPIQEWYIESITIKKPDGASGDGVFYFPVYSWITPCHLRVFFNGTETSNSPTAPAIIQKIRAGDLLFARRVYDPKWVLDGLPVGVSDSIDVLPRDEQRSSLAYRAIRDVDHLKGIDELLSFQNRFSSIQDIDSMYKVLLKEPPMVDLWKQDAVFGKQMVAGMNPVLIRVVEGGWEGVRALLPSVTVEQFARVPVLKGKDVVVEVGAGRFYSVDYRPYLAPFVCHMNVAGGKGAPVGGTLVAPIGLFYHDAEKSEIYPVAIQLDEGGEVFFPEEESAENKDFTWLLVKAFFALADSQTHELGTHLLKTHLCIEPFILATYRQLSTAHPIYKLLKPHFDGTININAQGREVFLEMIRDVLSMGDQIIDFFKFNYAAWKFSDMHPVNDLDKRGFGGKEATKASLNREGEYPWAEDTRDLFAIISSMCTDFVALFYAGDEHVKTDSELQAWIKECGDFHKGREVPESLNTRQELSEVLSMIIWTASAQHSSVNFPQYDYYGYILNRPTKTQMMPLQTRDGSNVTEQTLVDFLPAKTDSVLAISIASTLCQYDSQYSFLGDRVCDLFGPVAHGPIQVFEQFKQNLDAYDARVEARNALPGRKNAPYEWLTTKKVAVSTYI
ncbi:Hydroperoxide isomerase aloxe3 [Podochytrium sp. JEL0797]|nr:Hydroperoxide isomerase aloxe3 [Podochytrium sp. JEL0797]